MRVRQTGDFLTSLVAMVAAGDLAPAAFQRPYVWRADDVEAFFRSILEGWPVGSFLVWEPSDDVDPGALSRGRLGPLPPGEGHALILDGQNRLATLAWAMAQPPYDPEEDYSPAERETWLSGRSLVADAETRTVRFVDTEAVDPAAQIPVGDLCSATRSMPAMIAALQAGAPDEAVNWFEQAVASKIREARVVTTTLERASIDEARRAFLNIARAGVPMSGEDFDAVVRWRPEQGPRL